MYVGVSEELLKELNVRLVAIDRPGYGESDKHPQQTYATFAKDIDELADLLELGEKIWLLGYSCGGAYCWGAAYYIPDRIAGIAMWAPVGNYWWKGISEADRSVVFGSTLNKYSRRDLSIVRRLPQWVLRFYARYVFLPTIGLKHVEASYCKLSPSDIRHLQNPIALESLVRYYITSFSQGKNLQKGLPKVQIICKG
jgi:pimeloyl-ACP methyl ester carboxylesterase